ncbi:FAD-dependent oxidoreductase [Singulisphaera sp. GP187]|uniref:FAD-dependent oxidoreductase n=1 Tax=Singulisphaera sp. GP187 TaxID=1882752 RepID=UPI00094089C5|nr:FAD-dependent oxidoreductase [Singulisphaera sp. GP187]
MEQVDVLVVGGGTVGLAAAAFLAKHRVRPLVAERHAGPNVHPRATGVAIRTVEMLRELGAEQALNELAVDLSGAFGKTSARTVRDLDPAELPAHRAVRRAMTEEAGAISPSRLRGTCAQDRLDTVLLDQVTRRGVEVRYGTELLALHQAPDHVTGTLRGPAGEGKVEARYVVAADGAGSTVRRLLGIPVSGPGPLGDELANILFEADLAPLLGDRRFALCQITHPDAPGLVVAIDGERRWVFHTSAAAPDAGPEECRVLVRTALGDPDVDVKVVSTLRWRPQSRLADRFRDGRVFLAGDAAHTISALGAFGMNTGVADAHNLAWKLAHVLQGRAGAPLLDTYEQERRPVAATTVDQALLRLSHPDLHWDRGPGTASRRAAVGMLNAPVVILGYRYTSTAVRGTQPVLPSTEDIAANLDGSPGTRVPHVWLTKDRPTTEDGQADRLSTLDLVAGRWTLLAGPDGETTPAGGAGPAGTTWPEAGAEAARRAGTELACYRVGVDVEDPEGRFPAAAGISPDGALLVRPDGFVGWRSPTAAGAPDLPAVLANLIGCG